LVYLPFIVQALLLAPKMLMPRKSLHQHWGKPPGPDLSAVPFPFGVVAPTGDNGTSFPAIDEWDE